MLKLNGTRNIIEQALNIYHASYQAETINKATSLQAQAEKAFNKALEDVESADTYASRMKAQNRVLRHGAKLVEAKATLERETVGTQASEEHMPILWYLSNCYGRAKKPSKRTGAYYTAIHKNRDYIQGLPELYLMEALHTLETGHRQGVDNHGKPKQYKAIGQVNEHGCLAFEKYQYTLLEGVDTLDTFTLFRGVLWIAEQLFIDDFKKYLDRTSSFMATVDAQLESELTRHNSDTAIKGILSLAHEIAPDVPLLDVLETVLSPSQLQYVKARVMDEGTKTKDSKLKGRVQRALIETDIVLYNSVYNRYYI